MVKQLAFLLLMTSLLWVMPAYAQETGRGGGGIPLAAIGMVILIGLAFGLRFALGTGSRRRRWVDDEDVDTQPAPPPRRRERHRGYDPRHDEIDYLMERDALREEDPYYDDAAEEDFLGKQ